MNLSAKKNKKTAQTLFPCCQEAAAVSAHWNTVRFSTEAKTFFFVFFFMYFSFKGAAHQFISSQIQHFYISSLLINFHFLLFFSADLCFLLPEKRVHFANVKTQSHNNRNTKKHISKKSNNRTTVWNCMFHFYCLISFFNTRNSWPIFFIHSVYLFFTDWVTHLAKFHVSTRHTCPIFLMSKLLLEYICCFFLPLSLPALVCRCSKLAQLSN